MMAAEVLPTRAVHYELEIRIEANAARVWQALTEETNAWWLPGFRVAAADSTVTLDATPGGHLIERTADGGGVLWYTVHACRPRQSITLVGSLSEGCGPGMTMLTVTLEQQDGCLLRVSDTLFGQISDGLVESLRSGWAMLLGDGLARHAATAS